MSLVSVNKEKGALGTIGTLATLGGMITGQPWLTAIGAGAGAADTLMNGGTPSDEQLGKLGKLSEILKKIPTWINPAKNNVGKADGITSDEDEEYKELSKKWGPYVGATGYTGWPSYNIGR